MTLGKRGLFAALLLLAGLMLAPPPAHAQRGVPGGSWQQSCTNGHMSGDELRALCQIDTGGRRWATIRTGSCRSFGNRNGQLFCETSGGADASYWRGSFRSSCRDIAIDRRQDLAATCQAANGSWRRSNLAERHCPARSAGNRNGYLFCETGGAGGGTVVTWLGSFRTSCRSIVIDGAGALTAACQRANGKWRTTTLAPHECPSLRVGNRNGRLFCETGAPGAGYRWRGSYTGSCRDASVDANGMLSASCQASNGSWRRSAMTPRLCPSLRAGNRNGMLFCEG